jgi:hypothetical protein
MRQTAYFRERDRKRKEKVVAKRKNDKRKNKSKKGFFCPNQEVSPSSTTPNASSSADVTMSDIVDNQQASTSSTIDKSPVHVPVPVPSA